MNKDQNSSNNNSLSENENNLLLLSQYQEMLLTEGLTVETQYASFYPSLIAEDKVSKICDVYANKASILASDIKDIKIISFNAYVNVIRFSDCLTSAGDRTKSLLSKLFDSSNDNCSFRSFVILNPLQYVDEPSTKADLWIPSSWLDFDCENLRGEISQIGLTIPTQRGREYYYISFIALHAFIDVSLYNEEIISEYQLLKQASKYKNDIQHFDHTSRIHKDGNESCNLSQDQFDSVLNYNRSEGYISSASFFPLLGKLKTTNKALDSLYSPLLNWKSLLQEDYIDDDPEEQLDRAIMELENRVGNYEDTKLSETLPKMFGLGSTDMRPSWRKRLGSKDSMNVTQKGSIGYYINELTKFPDVEWGCLEIVETIWQDKRLTFADRLEITRRMGLLKDPNLTYHDRWAQIYRRIEYLFNKMNFSCYEHVDEIVEMYLDIFPKGNYIAKLEMLRMSEFVENREAVVIIEEEMRKTRDYSLMSSCQINLRWVYMKYSPEKLNTLDFDPADRVDIDTIP